MSTSTPPTEAGSPTREVRCLMAGLELRAAAPDSKSPGTLTGYAAVFNKFSQDLGGFVEQIASGAFSNCMSHDVRCLVNHDPNQLIGRTSNGSLRMTQDPLGLKVECDLPDTQVGRDAATQIQSGLMDGMSFSFDTESDSWDPSTSPPTRTLQSCRKLYDVGPVTFPAYEQTSAAMRSLERAIEQRGSTVSLNAAAKAHAAALITHGKVNSGAWSFDAADGSKLLGPKGTDWGSYGIWFLGTDSSAAQDTKGHYKYPYGKDGEVYLAALRAIRSRASQQKLTSIFDAAGVLLDAANKDKGAEKNDVEPDESDSLPLSTSLLSQAKARLRLAEANSPL